MAENTASAVSPPPWGGATDDRREQIFPTLSASQIAELTPFGIERVFNEGQILWTIGARNVDFFVVLGGTLEIVRRDAFGADMVIVSHGDADGTRLDGFRPCRHALESAGRTDRPTARSHADTRSPR
jgi:hypothetical protein